MIKLNVSIERNGTMVPAGLICGQNTSDSIFRYNEAYLRDPASIPVSISLPLQTQPFSAAQTKCFFEGLLPEGYTRRTVAQWMHVHEDDYLSILHGLGKECLGAICISEDGEDIHAAYEPISEQQVRELAAEGATKSAELVTKAHLSLTGASGKVGLYYDAPHDEWYLPQGTAPSTHIVKQSHVRLQGIVTNEQLALQTASRCGIGISESFIINTGSGKEDEVLFATRRYDRQFAPNAKMIGSLACPYRLHQEDFAQAMGIPASEKYEKEPKGYLRGMFELLRKYSAEPIADQLKLWDALVFDYLIGNTDAHIKNFSLLYSADLKSVRLAPIYDLVSTTVYSQSTREMAFRIGGALSLDDMSRDSFLLAARDVGIGERMAVRRFDSVCGRFRAALHESAEVLAAEGYPMAAELEESILETGGIRNH